MLPTILNEKLIRNIINEMKAHKANAKLTHVFSLRALRTVEEAANI